MQYINFTPLNDLTVFLNESERLCLGCMTLSMIILHDTRINGIARAVNASSGVTAAVIKRTSFLSNLKFLT